MPHRNLLVLLVLLAPLLLIGQEKEIVRTEVQAGDSVDIRIIHAFPDSFPEIRLTFESTVRPEDEPLWDLQMDNVEVLENGTAGEVISLEPLSEQVPLNLMMVLDHSGSMSRSNIYFDTLIGTWDVINFDVAPLDQAKESLVAFANDFKEEGDSVGVISFSDKVTGILPPTTDMTQLQRFVNILRAGGGTAFYSGVNQARKELSGKGGLRAIVALTDGLDNESDIGFQTLISRCQADHIPVYVIGLGEADEKALAELASETRGDFFHAETGKDLMGIYELISRRIKAVYGLRYRSEHLIATDHYRTLELRFDIPDIYQSSEPYDMYLKPEVRERVEQAFREDRRRAMLTWFGIGGGVLAGIVGIGIFLFRRRRPEKSSLIALTGAPNPTTGPVDLTYSLPVTTQPALIEVFDPSGVAVRQLQIPGESSRASLDLSGLPRGVYLARLSQGEQSGQVIKIVLQ